MRLNTITRKFFLPALMLSLSVSAFGQGGPTAVQTAPVVLREIAPAYWASGTVVSRLDGVIAAETAGRVVWVADVGDRVEKGQPLAKLDKQNLQIQRGLDRSEIARLEADRTYQKKQMARLQSLAERNNAAQVELDRLISEQENTHQRLQAARLHLQKTELDLQRADVPAPYSGVVSERLTRPGAFISGGASVIRLVNMNDLEASVRAPVSTLKFNTPGSTVVVTGEYGDSTGQIRQLVPVADVVSRMIELRVALSPGSWVVGEPVRVSLAQGEPRSMTAVPRDALVLRENEIYVMKISDAGVAEKVMVRPGFGDAGEIGVDGELSAGDRIVIRGAERLRPGQGIVEL